MKRMSAYNNQKQWPRLSVQIIYEEIIVRSFAGCASSYESRFLKSTADILSPYLTNCDISNMHIASNPFDRLLFRCCTSSAQFASRENTAAHSRMMGEEGVCHLSFDWWFFSLSFVHYELSSIL